MEELLALIEDICAEKKKELSKVMSRKVGMGLKRKGKLNIKRGDGG